jgi:hypothetical protein
MLQIFAEALLLATRMTPRHGDLTARRTEEEPEEIARHRRAAQAGAQR